MTSRERNGNARARPAGARPATAQGTTPDGVAGTEVPHWVIGVAASAGGLEALQAFVRELPPGFPAAVLVAQHLSPRHTSLLPQLLAKEARLPVVQAQDGEPLMAGVVAIAPANSHISVENGRVRLVTPDDTHTPKPSADRLFASLAPAYGARAVAIVLSGTGHDGELGVRAVKSAGGFVLVQDETARYQGMPRSAIDTGIVDRVMPAAALGQAVVTLIESGSLAAADRAEPPVARGRERILQIVHERTGFDLAGYKDGTVTRRLARRMRAVGAADYDAYAATLLSLPDEAARLRDEVLISVTSFMRDPAAFGVLAGAIEDLLDAKPAGEPFRVWIPGCATGEEAYSIAMLLAGALERRADRRDVRIFASDLNKAALAYARRGVYEAEALQPLGPELTSRFFTADNGRYEIAKPLREWVLFSHHDLTRDAPFSQIDLLSCRNVLIYLRPELNRVVTESLHFSLRQSGLLFVGQAEASQGLERLFEPIAPGERIFRKKPAMVIPASMQPRVVDGTAPPLARAAAESQRGDGLVLTALLAAADLTAVLVDPAGQVVRVFGDTTHVLRVPSGKPRNDIESLVQPALRAPVRTCIGRAVRSGTPVRGRLARVAGAPFAIRVNVVPLAEAARNALEGASHLVAFERRRLDELPAGPAEPAAAEDAVARQQLDEAREYIDTLIEQHNVSTEELQSLNEEIQSANEELQSSNEELETTNEELQAANEELLTVNEELTQKSREAARHLALLDGVMDAIPIAIVVIDRDRNVLIANRAADAIIGGATRAAGQPLANLNASIPMSALLEAIDRSGRTGAPLELQLQGERSYIVRVDSVSDTRSGLDGFTLTLLDNTALRQSERATADEHARLAGILALTPVATYVRSLEGRLLHANRAFLEVFALADAEVLGMRLDELMPAALAEALDRADLQAFALRDPVTAEAAVEIAGVFRSFVFTRFALRNRDDSIYGVCTQAVEVTQLRSDQRRIELQSQALDRSTNGILICDARSREMPIVYANDTFFRMCGYPAGDVIGRNGRFLHADDRDQPGLAELRAAIADGRSTRVRIRNYRRDGALWWNQLSIYPLPDAEGRVAYFVGVQDDVTRLVLAEEGLKLDQERLRLAQNLSRMGMLELDLLTNELIGSPINREFFGLAPAQERVSLDTLLAKVHPDDVRRVRDALHSCASGIQELNVEFRVGREPRTARWLQTRGNVARDETGRPMKLVALSQDVTERHEAEERLRYIAQHDVLTGLPNRALLLDRLEQAMLHARRHRRYAAVVFLDVDGFKVVNDTLGHSFGDRLLQAIAERLRGCLRTSDTLARLSGDEFVAVIDDLERMESVQPIAEKLVDALARPFTLDEHDLRVGASVGVSLFPTDGATAEVLLRHADTAMYHAKTAGGSRLVCFNDQMAQIASERAQMTNALRSGLLRDELAVHYQPFFNAETWTLEGVEALVRWNHPQRGLLSAAQFLWRIGDPKVFLAVSRWVIERAIVDFVRWRELGLPIRLLSINVSPLQFREPQFTDYIEALARRHGVPPRQIILEVTEEAMMDHDVESIPRLERLHRLGFQLAVDDFGKGYSSLSYLKKLPIDYLKIDRDFVDGTPHDRDNAAIVQAVLSIARSLGLKVIAEGVESPAQLDFLRGERCETVQGFALKRPVSAAEMLDWPGLRPDCAPETLQ